MNLAYMHLANLYAKAFFYTYSNELTQTDYETLKSADFFFDTYSQLFFITKLPRQFTELQKKYIAFFYQKTNLEKTLQPLTKLVLKHQRLSLLPLAIRAIVSYYETDRNIETFTVTSSHELSTDNGNLIRKFLEKKSNKHVIVHAYIDTQLIAGIRLQSKSLLWEYSVAKHIHAIKKDILYGY